MEREKCELSGNCADVCPAEALKITQFKIRLEKYGFNVSVGG